MNLSNKLFVTWFVSIIILDKIGTMFNLSMYITTLILILASAMFICAIHKVNTPSKSYEKNF